MSTTIESESIQKSKQDRSRWKKAVAGILGNFSTLVFQPVENVKIRLQVNDGMKNHHLPKYNGFIDTTKHMWKNEGIVSFYRGTFANIVANSVSGGVFFFMFEDGKKVYNYTRETSPLWLTIWISLRAGLATMILVNPIWWVKTRVILHWNEKSNYVNGARLFAETVQEMYIKDGVKSFFRGMTASLIMSFYGVVQMTVYEKLCKLSGIPEKPQGFKMPDLKTFIVGGASRWAASFVFYPVALLRTRLQKQRFSSDQAEAYKKERNIKMEGMQNKEVFYTNIKDSAKNIWRNEGIRGFYKGWLPNLLRIFPHSGLFFMIYEGTLRILD